MERSTDVAQDTLVGLLAHSTAFNGRGVLCTDTDNVTIGETNSLFNVGAHRCVDSIHSHASSGLEMLAERKSDAGLCHIVLQVETISCGFDVDSLIRINQGL